MRYVDARYSAYWRDEIYKMYTSDAICHYMRMTVRYADIVNGTVPEKDERTGDEIAEDFIARFGIKDDGGETNGSA